MKKELDNPADMPLSEARKIAAKIKFDWLRQQPEVEHCENEPVIEWGDSGKNPLD